MDEFRDFDVDDFLFIGGDTLGIACDILVIGVL